MLPRLKVPHGGCNPQEVGRLNGVNRNLSMASYILKRTVHKLDFLHNPNVVSQSTPVWCLKGCFSFFYKDNIANM